MHGAEAQRSPPWLALPTPPFSAPLISGALCLYPSRLCPGIQISTGTSCCSWEKPASLPRWICSRSICFPCKPVGGWAALSSSSGVRRALRGGAAAVCLNHAWPLPGTQRSPSSVAPSPNRCCPCGHLSPPALTQEACREPLSSLACQGSAHICFPVSWLSAPTSSLLSREGLPALPAQVLPHGAPGQGDRMRGPSRRCWGKLPGWADAGTISLAAAGK